MSKRSSLLAPHRASRDGFQQIPELDSVPARIPSPNDATIDIPLTTVTTNGGGRRRADTHHSAAGSLNEKTTMLHHHSGGRRRKVKTEDTRNRGSHDEEDTLTRMGVIYDKIMNFSIVTRYLFYVLPLALILAVPIVIGATVAKDAKVNGDIRILWVFTWVEIVWIGLWVSKLVAKSAPYIFQFLCGIVSSGTRKYKLVLKNLEIPLSLAGWALVSLATFRPLMGNTPPWVNIVGNILAALMMASLVFLAEKLLVQMISIGYHRQQYELKIRESKHNINLLSLLYDASRLLFKEYCPEFAEEDYLISDSVNLPLSKKSTAHARSGSQTPLKLLQDTHVLQNVGRFGDKITAAFGGVAQEVTGKAVFNPTSAHSIVVEALEKNTSSEALAKRIWMSFAVDGSETLAEEDIAEVLGPERAAEAHECFAFLDRDNNKDVSLDEMILTVCEIGRERKAIIRSLRDVDSALKALDSMLCVLVFVVIIFIFVAFLNASFATTLATAGTALLSLSFVFATTAQEVLGSCIFLFVKHPFDVGDRVDIADNQLVVERISLLYTVFKQIKTHKTTQVANIVLNTVWIENVSRSKAMREQILMYISFDTSIEDIQLLKNEMQNYVLAPENSRDFQPEIDVEVTGIAEMNKLELKVEIRHKSNWSNEAVRAARRSKFMCALVLALRKVPIYAPGGGSAALGSSDQPTYSVSVSDTEAAARRDAFIKTKEEKRMVPTTQASGPQAPTSSSLNMTTSAASTLRNRGGSVTSPVYATSIAPMQETSAMNSLNARHPASDPAHDWENDSARTTSPTGQLNQGNTAIDELRDVLRRQSTRGKRRARANTASGGTAAAAPGPGIPTIAEPGSLTYGAYMASQGRVSVGPRLPVRGANDGRGGSDVKAANDGFGARYDSYPQRPPTTPPKTSGAQMLKSAQEISPKVNRQREEPGSESPRPALGRERNNSFALEMEGVGSTRPGR